MKVVLLDEKWHTAGLENAVPGSPEGVTLPLGGWSLWPCFHFSKLLNGLSRLPG